MKKKIFVAFALVLLVTIMAVTFTACDPAFKWGPISGGDASAVVESNGGSVVKQGNHVYFINGYSNTTVSDNSFGVAFKQGIMRATLKDDGSIDANSCALVVPKFIYSADTKSGIAIFNGWIYYATPNLDKDNSGTPSTVNLDFMRTKIDGTVTQKIITLGARTYPYLFTPTAILYFNSNTIYRVDFTGMSTTKEIKDGAGAVRSELAKGVTSYFWNYDENFENGVSTINDYVIYTSPISTEENSERYANEVYKIKTDGSDKSKICGIGTYGDSPLDDRKIALLTGVVESDNDMTLFYIKNKKVGNAEEKEGTFAIKLSLAKIEWSKTVEKKISENAQTAIFPISYEKGVIATEDSKMYYMNGSLDDKAKVFDTTVTIHSVKKIDNAWYVYYLPASDATGLMRINLSENEGINPNAGAVFTVGKVKTDWIALDTLKINGKTHVFYFNTDDYGYINGVNIDEFDGVNAIDKAYLLGKMTDADAKAKEQAEAEKNK